MIDYRLTSRFEKIHEDVERSSDDQNATRTDIVSQLNDLKAAMSSASAAADQLDDVRQHNGQLQENIRNVESALAQSDSERNSLKANEAALKEELCSLEAETVGLRKEIEVQSHEDMNATSELQLQLEATSSALAEATESTRTSEAEIQSLALQLENAKNSHEVSEIFIASLQAEKSKIEEDVRAVEQKVREELTRASLKSKDQSRALFEQEQHKLMREKRLAEQNAQKTKEQLEAAKRSVVCFACDVRIQITLANNFRWKPIRSEMT